MAATWSSDCVTLSLQEALAQHRIVPVLVIKNADKAEAVAEGLHTGGLPIVEVTLRTEQSWDALARFCKFEHFVVGAGSVRTTDDLKRAHDLGAQFAVSPGYAQSIVNVALELSMPYLPGVLTPSEIMTAINSGLETVKWFPAQLMGGAAGLQAVSAPFPAVRFVPTGGVSQANLSEWLAIPQVAAVGGSWMVPSAHVEAGDSKAITTLVRSAVSQVKGVQHD